MVSKKEIETLAALARLKLSDAEVKTLQKDISNILEYVEAVSTAKIPSGSTARDGIGIVLKNVMREDTEREGDLLACKRENLLKALPKREGDYAVVRKIIEK